MACKDSEECHVQISRRTKTKFSLQWYSPQPDIPICALYTLFHFYLSFEISPLSWLRKVNSISLAISYWTAVLKLPRQNLVTSWNFQQIKKSYLTLRNNLGLCVLLKKMQFLNYILLLKIASCSCLLLSNKLLLCLLRVSCVQTWEQTH